MKPIVDIKNVNFIYNKGKDNEFHALVNVSLKIYPEEFVIIFGPSGCGKSTMLNIIAGLERPDNGEISVMGRNLMTITRKEFAQYHRNEVGMIYQAYNLITSLTVLDNVALPQIFVNVRKGKRNKWARQLLERFGILKHADKIPTELSGGQQQRIGIARAIVNNPHLILADEPVGNLDSVSAKNVLDILADLNEKEKKTIILVTHNPEYLSYGDRIVYMKDGVITHEVINKDKHKKIEKKNPEILKEEGKLISAKTPVVELRELMRAYQGLSPEQINILIMPYKSKIFANHFISTRNIEETKIFEQAIQRRLMGSISEDDFRDILNRPFNKGGVGLDSRTVDKILKRVNQVLKIAYYVYQEARQRKNKEGKHDKITFVEKSKNVSQYLLKTCYADHYKSLDEVQINRLETAVNARLTNEIQKQEFFDKIDKPFKEGGVGLNSKTARLISEELELILILGFGVVKTRKRHRNQYDDKNLNSDDNQKELTKENKHSVDTEENQDSQKKSKNKQEIHDPTQHHLSLADSIILAQHREKELKKQK